MTLSVLTLGLRRPCRPHSRQPASFQGRDPGLACWGNRDEPLAADCRHTRDPGLNCHLQKHELSNCHFKSLIPGVICQYSLPPRAGLGDKQGRIPPLLSSNSPAVSFSFPTDGSHQRPAMPLVPLCHSLPWPHCPQQLTTTLSWLRLAAKLLQDSSTLSSVLCPLSETLSRAQHGTDTSC